MKNRLCILICEHHRHEAERVLETEAWNDVRIISFPAKCGQPTTSIRFLDSALNLCEKDDDIFVISGSCISDSEQKSIVCPDHLNIKQIQFSKHQQCFSMFIGHEIVDDLAGKGFYLVTPGWLATWKQKVENWGFNSNKKTAELSNFFHDSAKEIFLFDTGVDKNSKELLKNFADFVDRPFDSLYVGLDFFRLYLNKIVLEWRIKIIENNNAVSVKAAVKKVSDYSMVVELLSRMTKISDEQDVIYGIRDLISMLFAPGKIRYGAFMDNMLSRIYSNETQWFPALPDIDLNNNNWVEFTGDFSRLESGRGFKIRISYSGETLSILEADEVAFPEYIEQYLSLALSIANVCGLAISNARSFNQIKSDKDKINTLLKEKELLLTEVHHRIKNNMNTIKGLLFLQGETLNDKSALAAIKDAENRVGSMMILYDKLYRSEGFKEISIKEYLPGLLDEIIDNFPEKEKIKFEKNIEDFILKANTLFTLGIILNELITNIMKYAFQGMNNGVVIVSASQYDKHVKIEIQDNGVGIPESVSFENSTGFGMQLISMLTEQIGGTINIERGDGTKFVLEFNV